MKKQFTKNKSAFNIRLNEEEFEMIKILKEKHAINISQSFKIFLKEMMEKMRKWNYQVDNLI